MIRKIFPPIVIIQAIVTAISGLLYYTDVISGDLSWGITLGAFGVAESFLVLNLIGSRERK